MTNFPPQSETFLDKRPRTVTRKVPTSETERESIILTLKSIHHDMMTSVQLMNVCFGLQSMLYIGTTFLYTLFTLFASYKAFYYHDIEQRPVLVKIYWCTFYNYFKVLIVYNTNRVNSENGELSTLVYKMMNRNVCSPLTMQSLAYQIKQLPSKASCGLFNLDYSLIMTVGELIGKCFD